MLICVFLFRNPIWFDEGFVLPAVVHPTSNVVKVWFERDRFRLEKYGVGFKVLTENTYQASTSYAFFIYFSLGN